ncbi:MAG: glycosyltransferase family 9 protein [Planctomycetota bacterium]
MSLGGAKFLDRLGGRCMLAALQPVRALQDVFSGEPRPLEVREMVAVKFWGAGNAALLLPVLASLKARYPAAKLTVVTIAGNETLYRDTADDVLTVRLRPFGMACLDLLSVLAQLRRRRVDLAIDFEQYVRTSQALLYLSGARQVIAFDTKGQSRAGLADVKVKYDDTQHAARSFLDLARAAGVHVADYEPGGLVPRPEALARIDGWLARMGGTERPLVVLHPGSGDNFPGRRWPTRRFGLIARTLVDERDALVVVTGSARERQLCAEVVEASERPILDLAGAHDWESVIALLHRSSLLISNDTGPVHIASALGISVLGLYGPNTPELYGPLSAGSTAFYEPPPCSPCITNFNYKTSRCLNPVCIRAITVDAVSKAALARLPATGTRERAGNRA